MEASTRTQVTVVSSWPLSEPVVRNRLTSYFNVLLDAGFIVCFVCPRNDDNESLLHTGIQLVEVELKADRPRRFVSRALREIRDALALFKRATEIQSDILLVTIPSMFLAFLAPYRLRRRRVILDVRDLTWEYLSEESQLQNVSKKALRLIFKHTLNFFSAVTVTNPTELKYVQRSWQGKIAPVLISNGITREQFDKLADLERSKSTSVSVGYIGNVGLAQNLDTLLEAASQLPDVAFTIVGAGTDFDRISESVAERKLRNVRLTGRVPWNEVREYYGQMDILYAQLAPEYSGAMPSKLYEYLATGKYVIYGGQGQAAETLAEFENYQLIPPCDVHALVAAIIAYEKSGNRDLSQHNREKVRSDFIREDAALSLVECVNDVISLEHG